MADPSRIIWMEGPIGTELMRRGIDPSGCLPLLNLTQPELIADIHRSYAEAGAEIFLTHSFTLNPPFLARHGLASDGRAIGQAAVALAQRHGTTWASIGPMASIDFPNLNDLQQTIEWLGDADGVLLETLSDATAFAAAEAIRRERPDWPIVLSFALRGCPGAAPRMQMLDWREIADRANDFDLASLGLNCGLEITPTDMSQCIKRFRHRSSFPLMARPNAGTPQQQGEKWIWPRTPEDFAAATPQLIEAGATYLGGCCGSTPEHLRAMRSSAEASGA